MKKLVLPLSIVAMLVLLGAAVAWDCLRMAANAQHRVALADDEIRKHERRLVKVLTGSAHVSPEVQSAVATYQSAATQQARHDAYDSLVASFRKTMSGQIDPTNPLDRKFMDDIAGAINRREIAEKPYDEEMAAYRGFLDSWRGGVARLFSSQARADWKQSPELSP